MPTNLLRVKTKIITTEWVYKPSYRCGLSDQASTATAVKIATIALITISLRAKLYMSASN